MRASLVVNSLFNVFHCTCWCVVAILRYIFIVHGDWLDIKCPGLKFEKAQFISFKLLAQICKKKYHKMLLLSFL